MRRLAGLAFAILAAAACGQAALPPTSPRLSESAVPAPAPGVTPVAQHDHGEPLDPGAAPGANACDVRLRSELGVAKAIRDDLRVPGVATDPATIAAVARDPAAETAALGIPLTDAETTALDRAGTVVGDRTAAITYWVNVGASERFGGVWIDPPGSEHYVVGIVGGDPGTLALARCLEWVDTRYVWANLSIAEGRARAHRIGLDMANLRSEGIDVNGVGYRENEGNVVVGVTHPTPELLSLFLARYGPPLRLEEMGPVVDS